MKTFLQSAQVSHLRIVLYDKPHSTKHYYQYVYNIYLSFITLTTAQLFYIFPVLYYFIIIVYVSMMMAVLNTSILLLLLLEIIFVSINMHSFVLLSVIIISN